MKPNYHSTGVSPCKRQQVKHTQLKLEKEFSSWFKMSPSQYFYLLFLNCTSYILKRMLSHPLRRDYHDDNLSGDKITVIIAMIQQVSLVVSMTGFMKTKQNHAGLCRFSFLWVYFVCVFYQCWLWWNHSIDESVTALIQYSSQASSTPHILYQVFSRATFSPK